MIHVYRYISALTVLLVLCTTYAVAVVPWFEPPPIEPRPASPNVPVIAPRGGVFKYATLFPPGHWVHQNPKIVEMQQCTLLIQNYEPFPDGRLKLKPCVLVFHPQGDGRPIVLEAPDGAELRFDRPLDFSRAEFGRVEKGTLSGEITIRMPPTVPGGRDELLVRTSGVWLDRESIRTSNKVQFEYGGSSGSGNILEIALRSEPDDAAKKKNKSLGAVHAVTLKHLERLVIATEGRALLGSTIPAPAEGAATNENAPLEVKCQGEVTFDVAAQLARFERRVQVRRLVAGGPPDQLTCEELLLAFAEKNEALKTSTANNPMAGRLKRIVAIGAPAVLQAPTSGMEAIAAYMEYSLAERSITLKSDKQNKVPQVSLRRMTQHFVAPELHYEMAEEGRLGRLHAAGPGELRVVEGEGPAGRTVTARWDKQVQVQPQERNHVISLHGAASVAIDPLGRFEANELHVWVREVAQSGPTVSVGQASAEAISTETPGRSGRSAYSLVPDRLLAIGNVRLASSQLDVDTTRLEAWFINLPAEPVKMRPLAPPATIREPVERVVFTPDAAPRDAIRSVVRQPTPQKFHVRGSKIQMQAVVRGQLLDLEDLNIEGQAQIDEVRTPEPNQEPFRMRGELLELRQGTKPEALIQVSGRPAEVSGRGISIAGGRIVVHRGKNEMRIDGPGEATMPGAEEGARSQGPGASGQGAGARGQVPEGRSPMHVVWQQGLVFDGQLARFMGDVKVRTATQTASAPVLEVRLSQRLDFQAQGPQQPELASVFFDGAGSGVHIVNRGVDEYGQQISLEQMQVRNLDVDRIGGTLHAAGPGWVSTVRLGNAALPGAPGAAQPAASGAPSTQLTSIHVAFEREIAGDLAKREIEFRQQVQTTYSPARDFADVIGADPLRELGPQMILAESDSLKIWEIIRGLDRWIEIEASGRTKVRGLKVDVDAPIIAYSSHNETLSLRGDGRARAKIWISQVPGQSPSWVQLDELRYNLRTGETKTEGVSNAHINLGSGFRLPAPTIPGAKKSSPRLP